MIVRLNEFLCFQRTEQTADIARIKLETVAQHPHVAAIRADLVKQPGLAERATTLQIAVLQRADVLCHDPVETANLLNVLPVHSLTLVSESTARNCSHGGTPWPVSLATRSRRYRSRSSRAS